MVVICFLLACLLIAGGITAVMTGSGFIVLERGWSMVISGSVVATGGVLLIGIALLMREIRRLSGRLEALDRPVERERPSAPAFPAPGVEAVPAPRPEVRIGEPAPPRHEPSPSGLAPPRPEPATAKAVLGPDLDRALASVERALSKANVQPEPPRESVPPSTATLEPAPIVSPAPPRPTPAERPLDKTPEPRITEKMPEPEPERAEDRVGEEAPAARVEPPLWLLPERPVPAVDPAAAKTKSTWSFFRRQKSAEDEEEQARPVEPAEPEHKAAMVVPIRAAFDPANKETEPPPPSAPAKAEEPAPEVTVAAVQPAVMSRDLFMSPEPEAKREEELEPPPAEPAPSEEPAPAQAAAADENAVQQQTAEPSQDTRAEQAFVPEPIPTVVGTYSAGGNLYVMFSDGSIEAETSQGTFRFKSLDELKAYIASGEQRPEDGSGPEKQAS